MNSDDILQLIQKSFRVSLGATAALVETLQDAQKRDRDLAKFRDDLTQLSTGWQDPQGRETNLAKLRTDFEQLTTELAGKGETTEREARAFVDSLMAQRNSTSANGVTVNTTATPVVPSANQAEIEALTAQLAEIRAELEKLRGE
jgi:polyhydroxyalkanoate synthesis regulator phasin